MRNILSILFTTLLFINRSFSKDEMYNVVDFGAINDGKYYKLQPLKKQSINVQNL